MIRVNRINCRQKATCMPTERHIRFRIAVKKNVASKNRRLLSDSWDASSRHKDYTGINPWPSYNIMFKNISNVL